MRDRLKDSLAEVRDRLEDSLAEVRGRHKDSLAEVRDRHKDSLAEVRDRHKDSLLVDCMQLLTSFISFISPICLLFFSYSQYKLLCCFIYLLIFADHINVH